MGLIGNFFGLLFSGGYTAKTLISEKESNREYEARRESFEQSFRDVNAFLTNYELNRIVETFVSGSINDRKIEEMLKDDMIYITSNGKYDVTLSRQNKIDLIMSKFGKVSSLTRTGCTRFGNFTKISQDLDSYELSKRVMQCVESNIKNATGRTILFGVEKNAHCYGGKYPSSSIIAAGTSMHEIIRIYNFVDIPYTPIKLEDLKNV